MRSLRLVTSAGLVVVSLFGCARQPEPVFVKSEEVQKLSELHQRQISEYLTKFFGNAVNPRLAIPADEDVDKLVDVFDPDRMKHGAAVFNRRCAGCHGITGDGNGEAASYLQPKPRDYRNGVFKFTSTPYGARPTRKDLARVIRRGAKGTSMPAFRFLPDEDVKDVVDYVILLSYRGELERFVVDPDYDADQEYESIEFTESLARIHRFWQQAEYQGVLPETAQPKYSDETIIAGRKAFLRETPGCFKCHGKDFRGQTAWLSHEFIAEQQAKPEAQREKINYDAWGDPAPAADLTARTLHGGRRPIDIYRRIYTGINGTPMPAFNQSLKEEPETIWHLVHYVLSVVEGREVEGLDEITAPPVSDQPASPENEN
jgi:mono/diheme cytochrome c family protein